MDSFKLNIPGKPEYLTMVRLAIGSIASTAGFDLDAVEDIKTSVSEACKLISCHGFEGFSDKYEIACQVEEGRIEITVIDDCVDHNLKKVNKPCKTCPSEGELGRFVMESLVSEVETGTIDDERRFIKMVKRA